MPTTTEQIAEQGFAIVPNVLSEGQIDTLTAALGDPVLLRNRAGIRHALRHPAVTAVAEEPSLLSIARKVLGDNALPIRATLFDKSPTSNWLVVWHQDTALPLTRQADKQGWGPWSIKDGVNYAHAPASALERVLALRLHLDDSGADNGPLRVLPGTHNLGVLSDDQIHELTMKIAATDCLAPRGGVLAMRPLLVHASSKSSVDYPRRVLHIEYASSLVTPDGIDLAVA